MSGPVSPAQTNELSEVLSRITPHMNALDTFVRAQVTSFEPEIREMAAYCLESTGKRLRPSLVFFSGWTEGEPRDELIRAAGVVEMIHLATLVHDDIMDRAELRRSRPTASRQFGGDAAVLLGDALFSQALHVAAQFPTPEVCRVVAEATRRVCSGEILQTLHRRDVSVSLADYYRVVELKTAELFRVSCLLGARLAGYPSDFVAASEEFGRRLGIAYQIYDDLADVSGQEERIGKTLGTDLASGKLTLPILLLLERVTHQEQARIHSAFRLGQVPDGVNAARMRELGVDRAVADAVEVELSAASAALLPHSKQPPVRLLQALCDLLRSQVASLRGNG